MKKMKKYILLTLLAIGLSMSSIPNAEAQCPMCRMSAESNLKNGGSAAKGLNRGILYMLSMPYILVGGIGFVWYKNKSRLRSTESGNE